MFPGHMRRNVLMKRMLAWNIDSQSVCPAPKAFGAGHTARTISAGRAAAQPCGPGQLSAPSATPSHFGGADPPARPKDKKK